MKWLSSVGDCCNLWLILVCILSLCDKCAVIYMSNKEKYIEKLGNCLSTWKKKMFLAIFPPQIKFHIDYFSTGAVCVLCSYVTKIERNIYTLSIIFWKCTSTVQLSTSLCLSELWISTASFFDLIFWALYPNTKSIESITLDFPLPFGPMMQEKR